jgi:integrase
VRAHRGHRAAFGIHLVRADALVFATLTRNPLGRRNALRAVQTAATKAKLGHVTAHDLRHALDAGLTLVEALRLARHASPAVTASVYADVAGDEARLPRRKAGSSRLRHVKRLRPPKVHRPLHKLLHERLGLVYGPLAYFDCRACDKEWLREHPEDRASYDEAAGRWR